MPDKKLVKHVHFLPSLETTAAPTAPTNSLTKKKKQTDKLPPISQLFQTVKADEQTLLNLKAKKAALLGFDFLLENYRRRGASMMAFAREIGMVGNVDYAKLLIEKNPQSNNIIDEIAIGLYVGGHKKLFHVFSEEFHSSFEILFTHDKKNLHRQNSYYAFLTKQLQDACKNAHRKDLQKTMNTEFSSDDSFTFSP